LDDDTRFLRLVWFFFVAGVDGVLRGVLSKPFDTCVTTGYIAKAIGPICV
jgi:hypothetical protein